MFRTKSKYKASMADGTVRYCEETCVPFALHEFEKHGAVMSLHVWTLHCDGENGPCAADIEIGWYWKRVF